MSRLFPAVMRPSWSLAAPQNLQLLVTLLLLQLLLPFVASSNTTTPSTSDVEHTVRRRQAAIIEEHRMFVSRRLIHVRKCNASQTAEPCTSSRTSESTTSVNPSEPKKQPQPQQNGCRNCTFSRVPTNGVKHKCVCFPQLPENPTRKPDGYVWSNEDINTKDASTTTTSTARPSKPTVHRTPKPEVRRPPTTKKPTLSTTTRSPDDEDHYEIDSEYEDPELPPTVSTQPTRRKPKKPPHTSESKKYDEHDSEETPDSDPEETSDNDSEGGVSVHWETNPHVDFDESPDSESHENPDHGLKKIPSIYPKTPKPKPSTRKPRPTKKHTRKPNRRPTNRPTRMPDLEDPDSEQHHIYIDGPSTLPAPACILRLFVPSTRCPNINILQPALTPLGVWHLVTHRIVDTSNVNEVLLPGYHLQPQLLVPVQAKAYIRWISPFSTRPQYLDATSLPSYTQHPVIVEGAHGSVVAIGLSSDTRLIGEHGFDRVLYPQKTVLGACYKDYYFDFVNKNFDTPLVVGQGAKRPQVPASSASTSLTLVQVPPAVHFGSYPGTIHGEAELRAHALPGRLNPQGQIIVERPQSRRNKQLTFEQFHKQGRRKVTDTSAFQ